MNCKPRRRRARGRQKSGLSEAADDDHRLMAAALRLARRGLGLARPNPSVGCLIARAGPDGPLIVGQGVTSTGGRPHAEANALAQAGAAARGATAYVTLEPCSHIGRAAPCSQALIDAGIARVVCALEDPDPRTAGGGFARMVEAGITITRDVMRAQAVIVHEGHLARLRFGRPHVTLKLALSADGKLGISGQRVAITNEVMNSAVHRWRSQSDGIVVGIGTVLSDDPALDVRLPGLASRSPTPIVFDSRLRLPLGARLVAEARIRPLHVVTSLDAAEAKADALAARGVHIQRIPPPWLSAGRINLDIALRELGKLGLTTLFVEGGLTFARALLAHDLVDTIILLRGQRVIGDTGIAALAPGSLDDIIAGQRFERHEEELFAGDIATYYRRRR